MENIFFIHAHPDDLIGSAGLALMLAERGKYSLHVVDLTRGERGLDGRVDMAECGRMRTAEEYHACALLGVEPVFLGETDGEAFAGEEVCRKMADLFLASPPRAVFTHWPVDRHADHVVCFCVVTKGLKMAGFTPELYFFEEAHQTVAMPGAHYVPFDERMMNRKLELCRCYVCQNPDDVMAQRKLITASYFGMKVNAPYAECYGSNREPVAGQKTIFDSL